MNISKLTLFSIILICFALVGKCMSHDKPSPTPSPSLQNEGRKTKTSTTYHPKTNDQFSDTPYMDPPSDSPSPTTDSVAFGYSASFSDYLKVKFGDQSKIKYNPSLQQICSHTHHADVCLATISPLLKHKFDVVHALEASITVCTQNLKTIIKRIEKHVVVSHAIAASLIDCKEHYSKALVNLHKALEAIHARNFGIVTMMLSGAVADVSTAESKIVDLKLTTFKVEYFSFVSVTASNCLSIASLIPN